MFRFKAVGTVFKALKTEHLTAPSPNLHIRSHTVGTVGPNVCRCVNLLLHVDTTLSNYIATDSGKVDVLFVKHDPPFGAISLAFTGL